MQLKVVKNICTESNRYTLNKLLLLLNDIIVVEIIFSLMKIVEEMSIKGV